MRVLIALALLAGSARAERHLVQKGETLEHVAAAHGCSVEAVLRANGLKTTLVAPGTSVVVPSCTLRTRAQTRTLKAKPKATAADSDDAKARAALDVIDGATWIDQPATREAEVPDESASVGAPWHGKLVGGEQLHAGAGYVVRRPSFAFGATHVVDYLRGAIAEVRALYPDVHSLAIGDLSAEHGGKLSAHRSHQSGLDVDVGFYFTSPPSGYPSAFAGVGRTFDDEATWALLIAFARTAAHDDGVEIIFLDYGVQRRLYEYGKSRGTPEDELDFLLQYPHGRDAASGLVRHWPGHADHLHVRFKAGT